MLEKSTDIYTNLQKDNLNFKFQLSISDESENNQQQLHLRSIMNKVFYTDEKLFKNDKSYKQDNFETQYMAMRLFYANVYEASKKVRSIVNFRLNYDNDESATSPSLI